MVLRAFYFIRALTIALTYYCINRSQSHLLTTIGKNWLKREAWVIFINTGKLIYYLFFQIPQAVEYHGFCDQCDPPIWREYVKAYSFTSHICISRPQAAKTVIWYHLQMTTNYINNSNSKYYSHWFLMSCNFQEKLCSKNYLLNLKCLECNAM